MAIPYASATSGENARKEITKILRRFGCEEIGFMDNFDKNEVLLAFKHRARAFQITVSAQGYAQRLLNEKPWTSRSRRSFEEYRQDALRQGHVAVNSIIRDWMKGQITAIECGILSFEAVFLPYMLTADGRPLVERLAESHLLPAPEDPKVVPLPGPHRTP